MAGVRINPSKIGACGPNEIGHILHRFGLGLVALLSLLAAVLCKRVEALPKARARPQRAGDLGRPPTPRLIGGEIFGGSPQRQARHRVSGRKLHVGSRRGWSGPTVNRTVGHDKAETCD